MAGPEARPRRLRVVAYVTRGDELLVVAGNGDDTGLEFLPVL